MSKYHLTFDGSHSLADVQEAINDEQALASTFEGSQLTAVNGKITNLWTFSEAEEIPPDVQVLAHPSTAPIGKKPVWSGVMLIEGKNAVVDSYR